MPVPALLGLLILIQPLSGVGSTIWPSNAVPGLADSGDPSALELGVEFRSEVNGNITGVRFYKASANTAPHIGNLWTTNGTLLASAPFTNETASGWQQVNFTNHVAISANTIYVASYHTLSGHYSYDVNYFLTNVDNPPLHAPASSNSTDSIFWDVALLELLGLQAPTNTPNGGNGVFASSSTSAFPT